MQQQHFKLLPGSEQVGRLEEPDSKRRSTVVLRFDKESASFDPAPTPFELELKSLEDVFEIGPETWEKIAITKAVSPPPPRERSCTHVLTGSRSSWVQPPHQVVCQ